MVTLVSLINQNNAATYNTNTTHDTTQHNYIQHDIQQTKETPQNDTPLCGDVFGCVSTLGDEGVLVGSVGVGVDATVAVSVLERKKCGSYRSVLITSGTGTPVSVVSVECNVHGVRVVCGSVSVRVRCVEHLSCQSTQYAFVSCLPTE